MPLSILGFFIMGAIAYVVMTQMNEVQELRSKAAEPSRTFAKCWEAMNHDISKTQDCMKGKAHIQPTHSASSPLTAPPPDSEKTSAPTPTVAPARFTTKTPTTAPLAPPKNGKMAN